MGGICDASGGIQAEWDGTVTDEKVKRPAFQFYPGDWRKDVQLRSCSVAARGLWIDLLCVAHECEPYGHLMINGRPMTPAQACLC